MRSSLIFTIPATTATLAVSTPANGLPGGDTICAPETGFFQSCSNGFRGCCKADACTIGYCPDVTGTTDNTTPVVTVPPVATPNHKTHSESKAAVDPTVCKPDTGFFQKCANGFEGCCKQDACNLGYCPSTAEKRDDPTVCPPGTGFSQSCSNGFRGCCTQNACTIGYCPDLKVREPAVKRDDTICALGTGFFQSCSSGFRGCCKQDACTIGHCPDVKTFETVTMAGPKAAATSEPNHGWKVEPKSTDPTVCAPGTGFFQSCSNGFQGCCKKDACTIGYCPSN